MRSPGLRIGKIRGVPIYLTPGWALITIVLLVIFTPTVARALGLDLVPAALVALGIPLLLAASVLAHELAHGLTAQRLGIPVREYVLSLWGGHTSFHDEIGRPGASALVAAVGPLTNGVLALVFTASASAVTSPAAALVLSAVAYTNIFVAVFNAVPALPMDGGRLLEALVWRVSADRDLGTLVAARVGQGVAVLVALVSIYLGALRDGQNWFTLIWGLMIASVLWQGAVGAARVATARRATRDVDLGAWAVPVTVLDQLAPITSLRGVDGGTAVLLAGPDGRPVAWVQPAAVQAVPQDAIATTPLSAVATALPPEALLLTHTGSAAVAQLARAARAGARFVVLVGLDGRALGAVDIVEASRRLPR
ncbi:site-2 protease family protein [Pseudactinotalea terrae]|uniref:site-2 protease family protein n=1 Tax=Pseudactinotalea terrae TaxID=1743262 RepID=UPI0012E301FF|nr:site-2 protease family protein [Pseudactinotalea terrae]